MQLHIKEEHPGMEPEDVFTVKVLSNHQSAFRRQMDEAFLIKTHKGGTLLNLKYEKNKM